MIVYLLAPLIIVLPWLRNTRLDLYLPAFRPATQTWPLK